MTIRFLYDALAKTHHFVAGMTMRAALLLGYATLAITACAGTQRSQLSPELQPIVGIWLNERTANEPTKSYLVFRADGTGEHILTNPLQPTRKDPLVWEPAEPGSIRMGESRAEAKAVRIAFPSSDAMSLAALETESANFRRVPKVVDAAGEFEKAMNRALREGEKQR